MNSSNSQLETPWGFFDIPSINIDGDFSQFEDKSLNTENALLAQNYSDSLSKTVQRGKKSTRKLNLNKILRAKDQNINAKRKLDLIENQDSNQGSCIESEFECLEKKLKNEVNEFDMYPDEKVISSDISTISASSPDISSTDQTKNILSDNIQIESYDKQPNVLKEKLRITSKPNKITQVLLDNLTGKLLFQIEQEHAQDQNTEIINLTRKEILTQDPMMLIYFYEKNLQFKKSNDFSGVNLKKI